MKTIKRRNNLYLHLCVTEGQVMNYAVHAYMYSMSLSVRARVRVCVCVCEVLTGAQRCVIHC